MASDAFQALYNRIAFEMARQDMLGGPIEGAVSDAIHWYQVIPYTFFEKVAETTTIKGEKFYELPKDYVKIHTVKLLIFRSIYPLNERDWDYIEKIDWGHNYWRGQPMDWCTFNDTIRLYPIPYDCWPMFISYSSKRSVDDDAWPTLFESLIRQRAKYLLARGVLLDTEAAGAYLELAAQEEYRMNAEATRRMTTNKIHPSYF
jgi:hypothetical protein